MNRYIREQFDSITRELELGLEYHQHIILDQKTNNNKLSLWNQLLVIVKNQADLIVASIKENKDYTVDIDFATLINQLKLIQELESSDDNELITLFQRLSVRYSLYLIYFSTISKCLNQLPNLLNDHSYYQYLENSKISLFIYQIQTFPSKILDFIRNRKSIDKNGWLNILSNFQSHVKYQCSKILMVRNLQFIGLPKDPLHFTRTLIKLPLAIMKDEVIKKKILLNEQIHLELNRFGKMSSNFPRQPLESLCEFYNVPMSCDNIDLITELMIKTERLRVSCKANRPSFISRYWPTVFLTLIYGPSMGLTVWKSRFQIFGFIQNDIIGFIKGLVKNWIWEPLVNVWTTVRHDSNSSIAMTSEGSLDTEVTSLQRMITDLCKDLNPDINELELLTQIGRGDLTEFMKIYELQLHHPIPNLVRGELIRSLLIQLQKAKVDGSIALNGIDKLLQSQELVFTVVAMSPALLIIYCFWVSINRLIRLGSIWSKKSEYRYKLSASLNNVERLLNYQHTDQDYENIALLSLEISNLRKLGPKLIPGKRHVEWSRDTDELIDSELSPSKKLNVVSRIYHIYGKYF